MSPFCNHIESTCQKGHPWSTVCAQMAVLCKNYHPSRGRGQGALDIFTVMDFTYEVRYTHIIRTYFLPWYEPAISYSSARALWMTITYYFLLFCTRFMNDPNVLFRCIYVRVSRMTHVKKRSMCQDKLLVVIENVRYNGFTPLHWSSTRSNFMINTSILHAIIVQFTRAFDLKRIVFIPLALPLFAARRPRFWRYLWDPWVGQVVRCLLLTWRPLSMMMSSRR